MLIFILLSVFSYTIPDVMNTDRTTVFIDTQSEWLISSAKTKINLFCYNNVSKHFWRFHELK